MQQFFSFLILFTTVMLVFNYGKMTIVYFMQYWKKAFCHLKINETFIIKRKHWVVLIDVNSSQVWWPWFDRNARNCLWSRSVWSFTWVCIVSARTNTGMTSIIFFTSKCSICLKFKLKITRRPRCGNHHFFF